MMALEPTEDSHAGFVGTKVGEKGTDLCPEHAQFEECVMVAHHHYEGRCYRVFKMGCGTVWVSDNDAGHCCDVLSVEGEERNRCLAIARKEHQWWVSRDSLGAIAAENICRAIESGVKVEDTEGPKCPFCKSLAIYTMDRVYHAESGVVGSLMRCDTCGKKYERLHAEGAKTGEVVAPH